jgi:hypothetical protein
MTKIEGKVGAFWLLPGPRVIGETCRLTEAERVGDNYNGRIGHHWLWARLKKPISLMGHAYTTVPRGRVLYCMSERRFVIFAAPEIIHDAAARMAVERFYGLSCRENIVSWETDPHYMTQPDLIDEENL